jgi:hypothetical protein
MLWGAELPGPQVRPGLRQEIGYLLSVDPGEVLQFDDIHAALACFALGNLRLSYTQSLRDLSLSKAGT